MSFWDDINPVKVVQRAADTVIGAGSEIGGWANRQINGGGPDRPTPPAQDPAIAQLTQQKQQQAQEFRAGIPQMEKGLTRRYAVDSHNQLAQSLAQIRRDAARRGIMNSGVRLGNEANAEAESAGSLASMKTQLHSGALSQADQLDQEAINSGIMQQQISANIQDTIYNQALKNVLANNSAMSSVGQAAGTVAGSALAKKE